MRYRNSFAPSRTRQEDFQSRQVLLGGSKDLQCGIRNHGDASNILQGFERIGSNRIDAFQNPIFFWYEVIRIPRYTNSPMRLYATCTHEQEESESQPLSTREKGKGKIALD